MRLTVLTANHPRHVALLHELQQAGHDVEAVIEPKASQYDVAPEYWDRVIAAEEELFGRQPIRVPCWVLRSGEVSTAFLPDPKRRVIVFSSSYIKPPLIDALIATGALNLHVGIAPEYRGSAPNAFAHYHGRPDLIGAQVQRLSRGLDAGEILAEVRPPIGGDYFFRSMLAVKMGIDAVVRLLASPEPWYPVRANDKSAQLSYTRHADFSEQVAARIMETADT